MFVNTQDYSKMFNIPDLRGVLILVVASILLSLGCFFIIRLSGKKSIAQLTMPQFVITLGLGTLIVQPLQKATTILETYLTVGVFIIVMIILERFSINNDKAEGVLNGVPVVLVKDGILQVETMKKARYTVDQLESMLRQLGIKDYQDLRTCTLEVNGKLGYERKSEKDFVTNEEFENKVNGILTGNQTSDINSFTQNSFDETRDQNDNENENTQLD